MAFQADINLSSSPFSDTTYFVADEPGSHTTSQFYQPFISDPPTIQLGDYDQGFLTVVVGSLQLVNRPSDSKHPFSGANYSALIANPMTAIPVTFRHNGRPIFEGSAILNQFNTDFLRFQIEAKVQKTNLLRLIVAETSSQSEVIGLGDNGSGKVRITTQSLHPFSAGEQAFFTGMSIVGEELEYNPSNTDTQFTITAVTDTTFDIDFNISDIGFENPSKGNYTFTFGTNFTTDRTFSISESIESIASIQEGVTVSVASNVIVSVEESNQLPNTYDVRVGDTVSISEESVVDVTGTNAYDIGSASATDTQLPFAFGQIDLQTPVIVLNTAKTEVGNPNLQVSTAKVEDDGQAETINTGQSFDFYTVPSGEIPRLTLNSGSVAGEASVSGRTIHFDTTNGDRTAFDFFGWLSNQLGYGYNTTDASNADDDNRQVSIYVTTQIRMLDFADQVARGLNMQFFLDDINQEIFLIDRGNIPSSADLTLEDYEIIRSEIYLPPPLSGLVSQREYNIASGAGTSANAFKLLKINRGIRIANIDTGRDENITTFSPSIELASEVLDAIKDIKIRPRVELTIKGINLDTLPGSRINFNSQTLGATGFLIVRKRTWSFAEETTTFCGDSVITPLLI
tara:strand:- start:857 stop:2734 length:1878 start_codon:yes stop_codon:yes gene_type:complete